jgi:hypothetical protein
MAVAYEVSCLSSSSSGSWNSSVTRSASVTGSWLKQATRHHAQITGTVPKCRLLAIISASCLARALEGMCGRKPKCARGKEGADVSRIIAIMLGRLRMSIKDCISTYCKLGGEVFGKRQPFHFLGQNKYDCAKLERIIQEVARNNSGNPTEDPLIADTSVLNESHDDEQERAQNRCIPCRVYVLTQFLADKC